MGKHTKLNNDQEPLNDAQKYNVLRQLYGPYEAKWYNAKGLVENSDMRIAERLGVSRDKVIWFTTIVAQQRQFYLDRLINLDIPQDIRTEKMVLYDRNIIAKRYYKQSQRKDPHLD